MERTRNIVRIPCLSGRGIFFIVSFLFLQAPPSFSQDHLSLRKEAAGYFAKDDFQNALITAQSALGIAELNVGKSNIDYAQILCDVGLYNSYVGNFEEAILQ